MIPSCMEWRCHSFIQSFEFTDCFRKLFLPSDEPNLNNEHVREFGFFSRFERIEVWVLQNFKELSLKFGILLVGLGGSKLHFYQHIFIIIKKFVKFEVRKI